MPNSAKEAQENFNSLWSSVSVKTLLDEQHELHTEIILLRTELFYWRLTAGIFGVSALILGFGLLWKS